MAYHHAGKLPEAIELFDHVRVVEAKMLGVDHPVTLSTMNNLANAYQAAGKLPEAIELLQQVRDAVVMKLGAEHPHTLLTMHNLACAYQAAGNRVEALPLFVKAAIGIEKRKFVHEHASLIVNHLIAFHEDAKQYSEAEAWRRKWLAVVMEQAGPEHPAYAGELAFLGWNLLKQKKWKSAEPILRECLALLEKLAPAENRQVSLWRIANVKSMLGEAFTGQERYAEAEPMLVAGYDGL